MCCPFGACRTAMAAGLSRVGYQVRDCSLAHPYRFGLSPARRSPLVASGLAGLAGIGGTGAVAQGKFEPGGGKAA